MRNPFLFENLFKRTQSLVRDVSDRQDGHASILGISARILKKKIDLGIARSEFLGNGNDLSALFIPLLKKRLLEREKR